MDVDQVEPDDGLGTAHEWYPTIVPEAAKILYSSAQKISENCRSVEQSRLLYMNDTHQSWNNHHLPLVRDMTRENADIRRSLRENGIIADADSAVGEFLNLRKKGFTFMYHCCLQYYAEGPEKRQELEAHPDNPRSLWARALGECENAIIKVHTNPRTWPYDHNVQSSDPVEQGKFAVQRFTVAYFEGSNIPAVLSHDGRQDVRWVLAQAQREHKQWQWKGFSVFSDISNPAEAIDPKRSTYAHCWNLGSSHPPSLNPEQVLQAKS